MLPLHDLQRELFRVIVQRGTGEPRPRGLSTILAEVSGDDRLDAAERVGIYARMYGTRLADALAEDYPRTATLLGWERFREVALAYVARYPSCHASLRWFGERFAEFLATTPPNAQPEFLADMARLEWARVMVFDAPDVDLLRVDALRALPLDRWPTLRLQAVPALEVIRVDWPVHEIWQAVEVDPTRTSWPRAEVWLRVWRHGDRVFQASMNLEEQAALAHVCSGDDFATICGGLAAIVAEESAAATAGALVLRWIEDELLRGDDTRV